MPPTAISLHSLDIGQIRKFFLYDRLKLTMYRLKNIQLDVIRPLFDRYQLNLSEVPINQDIPHSFWGTPEAGRMQSTLYAREDTPIHSLLHEACHFVCMPPELRNIPDIDAGGSASEENASCYLQILLSDYIPGFNQSIHLQDMDAWGYSFRLGSSARWFYADSDDAREWLIQHHIINDKNLPTWLLRQSP